MNAIDLTGRKYGRLTVLERGEDYVCRTLHSDGEPVIYTSPRWRCRCDCGNVVTVLAGSLKNGNTKSCGCYRREMASRRRSKGGESNAS